MKKILSFIILFVAFSIPLQYVHAQAQVQCDVIDASNYRDCCGIFHPADACADYTPPAGGGGDTSGGGGGGGSGPIINSCSDGIDKDNFAECCFGTNENIYAIACANYISLGGGVGTGPINNGPTTPGGITPTPQSSSTALLSCNKISFDSLLDILIWLKCIIGAAIIPLVFTLAFLFFLWGMIGYIRGSDDVKKREESKKFIYWGIIGLTVMVSIWGIVKIINVTFGFGNTVPELQTDYLKTPVKKP